MCAYAFVHVCVCMHALLQQAIQYCIFYSTHTYSPTLTHSHTHTHTHTHSLTHPHSHTLTLTLTHTHTHTHPHSLTHTHTYSQRGKQRVSYSGMILLIVFWLVMIISLFVSVGGKLPWLEFLYIASYVKLAITLVKYVPQVSSLSLKHTHSTNNS